MLGRYENGKVLDVTEALCGIMVAWILALVIGLVLLLAVYGLQKDPHDLVNRAITMSDALREGLSK